jgi:hypothetical protein
MGRIQGMRWKIDDQVRATGAGRFPSRGTCTGHELLRNGDGPGGKRFRNFLEDQVELEDAYYRTEKIPARYDLASRATICQLLAMGAHPKKKKTPVVSGR